MLIAFMIREDIFKFDYIQPYFKVNPNQEYKIISEVIQYHKVHKEVLNYRYNQLDLKMLDNTKVDGENREINGRDAENQNLKKNKLPFNLYL